MGRAETKLATRPPGAWLLVGCGAMLFGGIGAGDGAAASTPGPAPGEPRTPPLPSLPPLPGDPAPVMSASPPPESAAEDPPAASGCPEGMAAVADFCVDRWEAYVVEIDGDGAEHEHSPYEPVDDLRVAARTAPGVIPQGYISQIQAARACENAGKRLCSEAEFHAACRGPSEGDLYPYGGKTRIPGYCNEGKGSMMPQFYGSDPLQWTRADFNDARLNQVPGGLAPTGSFPHCKTPEGIYDCVGNLHEWISDPPDPSGRGRFRGGFYGDAERNGHGCTYVTRAHQPSYHDYSTGFRCCADPR